MATRSDEGFLFAAVTYRGPRGAFLDVAFRHVLELPIDVLIDPTGKLRTPELLELGGHQALLVRPLPGMPRAVPADLYVFDGQVLTALRGIGISADEVLAVADSLFAE